jgi:hypothetical protein
MSSTLRPWYRIFFAEEAAYWVACRILMRGEEFPGLHCMHNFKVALIDIAAELTGSSW